MGLDMFAYKTRTPAGSKCNARDGKIDEMGSEILHYWCKHPNLHGWMEALYLDNGGSVTGEWTDFNCNSVELDEDDLMRLEDAVKNDELPETEGFFFGETQDYHKAEDLQFIAKAREALTAGFHVFYTSWW